MLTISMATTTNNTTNETNNQTLLTVSSEKLERAKGLVQTLAQQLSEQGDIQGANSLQIAKLYPDCKSLANWVESVSREKKVKASEIHRIDLRNGRVVIRPKKQTTGENGKVKRKK
jgi:hypothetical protein